ncbi:MAG: DNA repair protein RecO [Bryobacteraceae bacterium]|nr:DNA repair protein RecO [Bryobacteraceae bacterium]
MPARVSESYILRTYPFQEADLIVSFFTRDQGKLRGVAKRARRPKSSFGAGLERLSQVRMTYYQRENRELVNLFSCELVRSQFELQAGYETGIALDFIAELAEQLLPPEEPSEKFFRLLLAVTGHLAAHPIDGIWPAVTYFALWAVRLSGFLPELRVGRESREIAEEMLTTHIGQLAERTWTRATAADLRRYLVRLVEDHVERRLLVAPLLESL